MKDELQEIGFLKNRGFNVDEEDNWYSISVHPRQHIHCKSLFIDKDQMSAIHKLGVIIKIEVHDYIRVEIIRNAWFINWRVSVNNTDAIATARKWVTYPGQTNCLSTLL